MPRHYAALQRCASGPRNSRSAEARLGREGAGNETSSYCRTPKNTDAADSAKEEGSGKGSLQQRASKGGNAREQDSGSMGAHLSKPAAALRLEADGPVFSRSHRCLEERHFESHRPTAIDPLDPLDH